MSDASLVAGLGGVLAQKHGLEYRVIIYASISLPDVERKYPQTEKEELGIVWGCEKFHMNLIESKFELWTDHRPLPKSILSLY